MSQVWATSQQTGGNLLVLLALADFANDAGECWPAVDTLARKARVTRRHAQRILGQLEASGEVVRSEQTGPHGTNRYTVRTPPDRMSPPGGRHLEQGGATFETKGGDAHVARSVMIHQDPPSEEKEDPLKIEAQGFALWFVELLTKTGVPAMARSPTLLATWADTYEKLVRIDGKTKAEIARVCRWARADSFWGGNFLSPVKLRKKNKDSIPYFEVFSHRMTHETTTDRRTPSRALKDNSSLDDFEALHRQQVGAPA